MIDTNKQLQETLKQTVDNFRTLVPDWYGMVDQNSPEKLAAFISAFPEIRVLTIEEVEAVLNGATVTANPDSDMAVVFDEAHFSVVPNNGDLERFYCRCGTHTKYGNFALFWSARGPGYVEGVRPRPCFLFCDREAVFMEAA